MKKIMRPMAMLLISLFLMTFCLPVYAEDAAEDAEIDFDVAAMSDEEAFQFMNEFVNRTPDALDADEGKVMHIKGQVSRYTKVEDDTEKVSCSVGIKGEGGVIWGITAELLYHALGVLIGHPAGSRPETGERGGKAPS